MSTEAEVGEKTCPFTLELCEDCCERKIFEHQEKCSFTFEPCLYHVRGGLDARNGSKKAGSAPFVQSLSLDIKNFSFYQ